MSSSSDGRDFQTNITADPSQFVAGMDKAKQAALTASDQINSQFKKIGDTVNSVNKYMMGFVAVLAGGGALKKFISDANEWNGSAGAMAKALGISTEKASVLNVALNRLGMDSDTYIGASQKLSKQIHSNAAAFETLGVQVKDTAGNYRPVTEVMDDVNQKLAAIKNPIEQNIAGQQVYGKGWAEIKGILRLTSDQMIESERRARELGLIVGPEGVAMSKQYKMQMADLNLVGKSLEVQFGNVLLPVFTRLGSFMSEQGPEAGQVFARILEGIGFAAAATWLSLKDMGDGIGAIAAQAAALLSGDIAGFKAIGRARDEEYAKNEAAFEKLKSQFGKPLTPPKLPADPDLTKGPKYDFKPEGEGKGKEEKSRTGEWEAQLAEEKLAFQERMNLEGSFAQYGKQTEAKFWQDKLALTQKGSADNLMVRRKMAELGLAIGQAAYQDELAKLQTQEAGYKTNMTAKLAILDQEAALVKQRFGTESKEYEAVQKQIVEAKRQASEQLKQIDMLRAQGARDAALAELQGREQVAQLELQLGVKTQQEMLAQQLTFENEKNAIQLAALTEREQIAKLDPDKNTVELARIHLEIEQLERTHQLKLGAIRNQAVVESKHYTLDAVNAMGSGFQSVFQQAMQGQLSLRGVAQGMWQSMTQSAASAIAKIASDWLIGQIKIRLASRQTSLAEINNDAVAAGGAAYKAVVGIPFVGPVLAPVAAGVAYAGVMAFGSMASAEGGYDIPGTLNPITQLHANEMVLPAKHADVIRGMADQGQGGGGGGDVHLHVNATDAQSVARLFRDNGQHLVAALQKQRRNLAF